MDGIEQWKRKKISLEELSELYLITEYLELVKLVLQLLDENKIEPVKNSKKNGKNPWLYNCYRLVETQKDSKERKEELQYYLHTSLNIEYYLNHLELYEDDREDVLALSHYFNQQQREEAISINERSFEIWGREKFIQKQGGKRILHNLGLSVEHLNIYHTTEPLSYYSHNKITPQQIIIIENKDTFYSMRRHLLKGNKSILGEEIGTLIYGGGKGIHQSFYDFDLCVEPYLACKENTILYFGDLDYEGIGIFETFQEVFMNHNIIPFMNAYRRMLTKAEGVRLPKTKDGQNRNIGDEFLQYFNNKERKIILQLLELNLYIPQEIINIHDF